MSQGVCFAGVFRGMKSEEVTEVIQVTLRFYDVVSKQAAECEFCSAELDKCSDAMMLGFPTLSRLGYAIHDDDTGNTWVAFYKLGIGTIAEMPGDDRQKACLVRPVEPMIHDGGRVVHVGEADAKGSGLPMTATLGCAWSKGQRKPGSAMLPS